jgi:Fe-S oxidoreductase
VKLPFIRKSINRLTGFHPKRTLPTLGRQTLRAWYKHWERTHISSNKPKVVVFCDEFTNYNDVEIGKKLILMLEKLGYNPVIVQHPESGRSFMSKGMIRVAQKLANEQVRLFSEVIDENTPLIGIEPSAILSFRDEYIDLVAPDLKEKSKILAKHVYTFEEWFVKETLNSRIKKEQFSKTPQSIKLHVHCHQKALTPIAFSKTALEYPENYRVEIIPSGCCGMAGSFGYEKEHFDLSMQVGELVLFKKIRACASDEIIVATGTSCRHQIHDGVGKTAFHPIEILYEAIVV